MKRSKSRKQRFTASLLGILLGVLSVVPTCIQAEPQEISLEKTAAWESTEDYQAVIRLKASGIEKYTQKEVPISVIPLLDVTASMDHCETPGHYHKIFYHWMGAFEGAAQLWKNSIVPVLPTPEEYEQMGQENADAMLLKFPEEIDPSGKCRLVYQKGRSEQKDYYSMFNWMVFYVADDGTPLYPLREGYEMSYDFGHTVFTDGAYLPVGTAQEAGGYIAWAYTNYKEPGHGCEYSRLDQLKEGYSQFIQSLFENPGARVCPVAFVGGYYINGWTDNAQEAIDFIAQEDYLEKEQVMPDYNCGTNYEAALAGAMDAAGRLEKKENTFAILFTDGVASSGYDHTFGEADLGRLDTHSYEMPDHDENWYPVFADWAIQDAQMLKESIPIYSVGYGSALDQEDAMKTLQKISSGGEYFIDTRSTSIQTVADIFRVIYSDLIYKATKVHIVDYISEFWEIEEEKLPEGCSVEQISIFNRNGQPDTISKIIYPITKEMGADDQEELFVPIVLREAYRKVTEKTLYETNQDAPLHKDQEGSGAYLEYVNLEGEEQRTDAKTPKLDVCPKQPDFLLEKRALDLEIKAGEIAQYEFRLVNCGQLDLQEIRLEDVFSEKGITLSFAQAEGVVQEKTGVLRIESLKKGEEKILTGTAEIPEDFQGSLENTVTAAAKNPLEPEKEIRKEAKASVTVLPFVPEPEKEPEPTPASGNSKPSVSENTVSDNSKPSPSENIISDNSKPSVSENTTSGNSQSSASENTISQNTTSENFVSGNLKQQISENALSENVLSDNYGQQILQTNYAAVTETPDPSSGQKGTSATTAAPRTASSTGTFGTAAGAGTDGKGTLATASPKTGDDAPLLALTALTGIAAAMIAALCFRRFCRKE